MFGPPDFAKFWEISLSFILTVASSLGELWGRPKIFNTEDTEAHRGNLSEAEQF